MNYKMQPSFYFKILMTVFFIAGFNTAYAEEFSYNYFEGGLNHHKDEEISAAFELKASRDLGNQFNAVAGLSSTNFKMYSSDILVNQYAIGLGYHTALTPKLDLTTELAFLYIDATIPSYSYSPIISDTGAIATVGMRYKVTEQLEAHANIEFTELDSTTSKEATVGGLFKITDNILGGISYKAVNREGDGFLKSSLRWQSL